MRFVCLVSFGGPLLFLLSLCVLVCVCVLLCVCVCLCVPCVFVFLCVCFVDVKSSCFCVFGFCVVLGHVFLMCFEFGVLCVFGVRCVLSVCFGYVLVCLGCLIVFVFVFCLFLCDIRVR